LPSYPYVFKLINDVIPYPKETDRQQIMSKYQLVKTHDRVGRMADTWEYSQVTLPRARFSPALLQEFLALCPSIIQFDADTILIDHVYIERRMTPLNIYLTHATDTELDHAMLDMAMRLGLAAPTLPGDTLQDFGVLARPRRVLRLRRLNTRAISARAAGPGQGDELMTACTGREADMFPGMGLNRSR
jgi:isocitrate dehydrogenase kinase/phosphatase